MFKVENIKTAEMLITEQETKINEQKIQEAKAYLTSTAWYVERFNDPSSGKAVPQEILDGRAKARITINELEVLNVPNP